MTQTKPLPLTLEQAAFNAKVQPPTHHSCASNRAPRELQRVLRVLTSYNWECKFVAARQPAEFLEMGTLA